MSKQEIDVITKLNSMNNSNVIAEIGHKFSFIEEKVEAKISKMSNILYNRFLGEYDENDIKNIVNGNQDIKNYFTSAEDIYKILLTEFMAGKRSSAHFYVSTLPTPHISICTTSDNIDESLKVTSTISQSCNFSKQNEEETSSDKNNK